jgi:uncharacterized membrane protein YqjE
MSIVRSIPELLHDIVANFQHLIRSELQLAKTEMREEAAKARRPFLILGLGITTAAFALFFLFLAAVYALQVVVPTWAASIIVAATAGLIAAVLFTAGKTGLKQIHAVPERTIDSLKENVQWPDIKADRTGNSAGTQRTRR